MDTIKIKDKNFKVSISKEQIAQRVKEVAQQIDKDLQGKNPLFLAVLNGSFMFAADLLRDITTPCEISFVRLASYSGTKSTGVVRELIGLNESIKDRHVVIIEDIIDSGKTMVKLLDMLKDRHPASIHISSLLVKPDNLEVKLDIPYCCFEIPNDFIIGYGLDYDGEARNLPCIYTVTD